MNTALAKLPLFGFALSLEKWRWDFFGGKIKDGKINKRWWERKFVRKKKTCFYLNTSVKSLISRQRLKKNLNYNTCK